MRVNGTWCHSIYNRSGRVMDAGQPVLSSSAHEGLRSGQGVIVPPEGVVLSRSIRRRMSANRSPRDSGARPSGRSITSSDRGGRFHRADLDELYDSRSVVSDHCSTASGNTACRRRPSPIRKLVREIPRTASGRGRRSWRTELIGVVGSHATLRLHGPDSASDST